MDAKSFEKHRHHDSLDMLQAAAQARCPICRIVLKATVRLGHGRPNFKVVTVFNFKHANWSGSGASLLMWIVLSVSSSIVESESERESATDVLQFLISPKSGKQLPCD
jgi:hypothetical protein